MLVTSLYCPPPTLPMVVAGLALFQPWKSPTAVQFPGSVLTPMALPHHWFLIVVPACSVATGEIFAAPELTRNTPPTTIAGFLARGGSNDCEAIVRRRYPPVAAALEWLGHYARARLTGTGGAVFASFETESEARRVLAACPPELRAFVARGVNESPLEARLATARAARRQ